MHFPIIALAPHSLGARFRLAPCLIMIHFFPDLAPVPRASPKMTGTRRRTTWRKKVVQQRAALPPRRAPPPRCTAIGRRGRGIDRWRRTPSSRRTSLGTWSVRRSSRSCLWARCTWRSTLAYGWTASKCAVCPMAVHMPEINQSGGPIHSLMSHGARGVRGCNLALSCV